MVIKGSSEAMHLSFTRQEELTMHEKSVELLNRAVADELSAVHQYMYFHFHCDDQGYDCWPDCSDRPLSRRCSTSSESPSGFSSSRAR